MCECGGGEIIALFLQGATLSLPLTVGNDNHDNDDEDNGENEDDN